MPLRIPRVSECSESIWGGEVVGRIPGEDGVKKLASSVESYNALGTDPR